MWNSTVQRWKQEFRQEGEANVLLRLLERKFGPLDIQTRTRVESADADRLLSWADRILFAERLEQVFGE